jgi:hypothetical protein
VFCETALFIGTGVPGGPVDGASGCQGAYPALDLGDAGGYAEVHDAPGRPSALGAGRVIQVPVS